EPLVGKMTSTSTSTSEAQGYQLPWTAIPKFIPGSTDVTEYSKKLQFLAAMWPKDSIALLAPRAALLCEGSAFKKGHKGTIKTKTYDAHMVEEAGPDDTERAYQALASAAPPTPVEEPEGDLDAEYVEAMVAAEDQDALQIQAFEEELEGFFQDTPELQEALVSYLEARSRLLAKRKARGFWPIASGQKGAKGGKGFKGKGKGKNACVQWGSSMD
ncbi:unnamed protein product, partial [Symbiodinium microadriaticum]